MNSRTMVKKYIAQLMREEDGLVIILAVIMLLLGGLMIPPIMQYAVDATTTTTKYQDNTYRLYSADAGIEHAIWEIRHEDFARFDSSDPFDDYDYSNTGSRQYILGEQVNGLDVHISVENVWIPRGIDGNGAPVPPDPALAHRIVNSGTVRVTSSATPEDKEFIIKISAARAKAVDMKIERIGIWLPPSYSYHPGSSTLDSIDHADREYYRDPDQVLYDPKHVQVIPFGGGGQIVIWDFTSGPDIFVDHWTRSDAIDFGLLPGVNLFDTRPQATIHLRYDTVGEHMIGEPEFISWVDTTDDETGIPYSWDSNTKLYRIISDAGGARIEAYTSKTEGQMASTTAGEFMAVGNSSLLDFTWGTDTRELQLDESSAQLTPDTLPDDASIVAARLYWTGYLEKPLPDNPGAIIWAEDCRSFRETFDRDDDNDWWNGDGWESNVPSRADATITGGIFKGHNPTWSDDTGDVYLYMTSGIDLSDYAGREVLITWDQGESGELEDSDILEYAFSNDANSWDWQDWRDNASWHRAFRNDNPPHVTRLAIDPSYVDTNFRLAFRMRGFNGGGEECYIDDIYIYNLDDHIIWQDDCSAGISSGIWNQPGTDWRQIAGEYTAQHIGPDEEDRTLTMDSAAGLNLSSRLEVIFSWDMDCAGSLENGDYLEYSLWNAGAASWESQGTVTFTQSHVEKIITDTRLLEDFRIRYRIHGFDQVDEFLSIDNITVSEKVTMIMADNTASLQIHYPGDFPFWAYYENGVPARTTDPEEAGELVATTIEPERIAWFDVTGSGEYGYACTKDVTDIVQEYIIPGENVTITVGDIDSQCMVAGRGVNGTAYFLGWSLVLVYTSPDTLGHRLIIYDSEEDFAFLYNRGHQDYACQGFVVPQRIDGEEVAATIHAFIAEGDPEYESPSADPHGDCLTLNGVELWSEYGKNHGVPTYNTWDSHSMLCSNEGVDVETFVVDWDDGLLEEGDTSADVSIWAGNPTDGIAIVYIAMSFRSELNTSGALSYRIR